MNTAKHKPKHHDLICEYCGQPFQTNLPQAAFHSNACRQAAYRRRLEMTGRIEKRSVGRPRKNQPESCNGISS